MPKVHEWTTKAGLKARALRQSEGHLCGYVRVPEGHPIHGTQFLEDTDAVKGIEPVETDNAIHKATIQILPESPCAVIDVYGGLTYSGTMSPVFDEPESWWFGFDCNHADDIINPKDLPFVRAECERMAEQLISKFADKERT